jgi:glyoxylase-like metal-dependent hydrolase (beta-lactamase superfamily II)
VRFGEVDVVAVFELEAGGVIQSLLPQATAERLRAVEWLAPRFSDRDGRLAAAIQSFVVRSGGQTILVDTGVGDGKERTELPEWAWLRTGFLGRLRSAGVEPSDVSTVVCTHLHVDHVGWNTSGSAPTFPRARYLFVREEYERRLAQRDALAPDLRAAFDDSVQPVVDAGLATLVEPDHPVDARVRLVPTPGHSPAHASVAIDSGGERALISGDVLHHPCQLAFPEWSTGADEDPALAAETRACALAELAASGATLIGSHFAGGAVGRVRRLGDGYALEVSGSIRAG